MTPGLHHRWYGDRWAQPPVVFLHGLGMDRRIWEPVVALLPRGVGAITLDLPGHGLAPVLPEQSGMPAVVAHVLAVLDHHEVGRAVLVALREGGVVAGALAEAHPERVAGIVRVEVEAGLTHAHPELADRLDRVAREGLEAVAQEIVSGWPGAGPAHRAMLLATPVAGYLQLAHIVRAAASGGGAEPVGAAGARELRMADEARATGRWDRGLPRRARGPAGGHGRASPRARRPPRGPCPVGHE